MDRKEIYKIIDGEREYQEAMVQSSDRPDMVQGLNLGASLTAIRHILSEAEASWYKGSDPHQETMGYLRKVAGLIVQAGENYGMPEREIKNWSDDCLCRFSTPGKFKEDCNFINCSCRKYDN